MGLLSRTSMKARILFGVSLAMILLGGALSAVSQMKLRAAYEYGVETANNIAVRSIAHEMELAFEGVHAMASSDGGVGRIQWDGMPEDLPDDLIDAIGFTTGLHVTIVRWQPERREFVREATTIEVGGERAVGTVLARGPVYDAMLAGEPFRGEADILGLPYMTYYHPVTNGAGQPVGIFFAGYESAGLAATMGSAITRKIAITVALVTLFLGIMYLVVRSQMRPLEVATRTITDLSEGRLDGEIVGTDRRDEIGSISRSLVVLRDSMVEARRLTEEGRLRQKDQQIVVDALGKGLSQLAALDLRAHIRSTDDAPFPADYEALRQSFNRLVEQLTETLHEIRETATEVEHDATELNGSAEELSQRAENQAATLEESAAALMTLKQSVGTAAENATNAEREMTESQRAAQDAGGIVRDAIDAMGRIESSSEQITQIISVIEDIAFQTNLLALNAGVEAARAGEAGKGFAVVASEVRSLAQRSSDSAKEIRDLISSSQSEVETGSGLVARAGDALTGITDRIDAVTRRVVEIATAAREQSQSIGEINTGVQDLDTVTQRNAAMAEAASHQSEKLSAAAQRMTSGVGRFRLATPAGTRTSASPVDTRAKPAAASARPEAKAAAAPKPAPRPETLQTAPPATRLKATGTDGVLNPNEWKEF